MENTLLYPMQFKPIFKDKIWGGNKIKQILNKDYSPLENCGEIWVLSGVEGNETEVQNGFLKGNNLSEITEIYMDELLGDAIFTKYGEKFPLLIKFIDANDDLSIQVHPDDEVAMKKHNSFGKSEMWYVMQADAGAEIITGFNRPMDKETYLQYFEKNAFKEILNVEKALEGDVYYQPAGRVHAIGKGVLLAEIQQSSDVTYRIFDYNRKDKDGNERELHTDDALDAIDFEYKTEFKTPYKAKENETATMVDSSFFTTNIISFNQLIMKDYSLLDSFVIYTCVEGQAAILYGNNDKVDISMGEAVLIPAVLNQISLIPDGNTKILETYINFGTKIV